MRGSGGQSRISAGEGRNEETSSPPHLSLHGDTTCQKPVHGLPRCAIARIQGSGIGIGTDLTAGRLVFVAGRMDRLEGEALWNLPHLDSVQPHLERESPASNVIRAEGPALDLDSSRNRLPEVGLAPEIRVVLPLEQCLHEPTAWLVGTKSVPSGKILPSAWNASDAAQTSTPRRSILS